MKMLKTVSVLLLLALAGCKQSSDMLLAVHAAPATEAVRAEYSYAFSGAGIPASAARGQVYEYH